MYRNIKPRRKFNNFWKRYYGDYYHLEMEPLLGNFVQNFILLMQMLMFIKNPRKPWVTIYITFKNITR